MKSRVRLDTGHDADMVGFGGVAIQIDREPFRGRAHVHDFHGGAGSAHPRMLR